MTHGTFATVEDRWTFASEAYARVRERFAARPVGGVEVWLGNDADEVLLVRNAGTVGWAEPGGKHEPGELAEVRWWDTHPASLWYVAHADVPSPARE